MRTLVAALSTLLLVGCSSVSQAPTEAHAEGGSYAAFQQAVYARWYPPPGAAKVAGDVAIDQYGTVRNIRFTGAVNPQVQQSLNAAIAQTGPLTMYSNDAMGSVDGLVRVGFEFDPALARGRIAAASNPPVERDASSRTPVGRDAQAQLGARSSSSPDANAVQACVAQIQASRGCASGVRVGAINQVDRRITATDATVITDIDFTVVSSFAGTSGMAENCTGTAWDMDPAKVRSEAVEQMPFGVQLPGGSNHFLVGQRLRVRKSFTFQKFESGWRCVNQAMSPVDSSSYLSNN